jgi:tRNA pseudouridine65 synthase
MSKNCRTATPSQRAMEFRILYQDADLIAVDKPAGFQVHQPEDTRHRVSKQFDCLHLLRKQIEQYLYPVHRLDRATSGVLIFALNPEAAAKIAAGFQQKTIKKTYFCVTRGWVKPSGKIDRLIQEKEAETDFHNVAQIELPHAVGRYPSARYSLVQAEPLTGRMHQIRKHFSQISHPLIGDTIYGDHPHNVFFREKIGIKTLLLKAYSLELDHPVTGERLRIHSKWNPTWHQVFELFGVCARG